MRLLRTIRALFRARRAAGGEVWPIDHGDDIPARLSPGAPVDDIDPADTVHVITLGGGRKVAFEQRDHAEQAAARWNETHPDDEWWTATGPKEGGRRYHGEVWGRVPDRQYVHHRMTAFTEDDEEATVDPLLRAGSRWTFEFEVDAYTRQPSVGRVEKRPPRHCVYVEAEAYGVDADAVEREFERVRAEAQATARRMSTEEAR
ncbi:hypothetical protein F4561_002700 [Lipingzhangella halophila]|uniref:Uncharacterized protein n=1 Tax=Lipingzhangella halophila TaxID=1783352 RepID=A0A7W7RHB0_9ACTN|nr:hypothetical protein [Lipingzhangella halophila]MBB4931880.1 hypothetical protein [Lipingzhangella halophila]